MPDLITTRPDQDAISVHLNRSSKKSIYQCREGSAADGAPATTPSLFVNGSIGSGLHRRVTASVDEPLSIFVTPPAAGGGSYPFVLYGWRASPSIHNIRHLPSDLGMMCLPSPLTGDGPPFPPEIWNNLGRPGVLGEATRPSTPAPTLLEWFPSGAGVEGTFFLQGLILDRRSGNRAVHVTNGIEVILR